MGGIFISYRREDSAGHSGRLFDRLREQFGKEHVFMDVSGIEPGVDFVEAIDTAVGSCDALIVVIGRNWLSCTDAAGNRRLDDTKDFIRLETGAALRRNIRVVPVLVQGAAMPTEKDLPEDLVKLARRQAIALSDAHWDSDTEVLIEALEKMLPGEAAPAAAPPAPPPPAASHAQKKNRLVWLISTITAIVVALGGLLSSIESVKNTFSGFFSSKPEQKIVVTTPPLEPPARERPAVVPEKPEPPARPAEPAVPLRVPVPKLVGLSQRDAVLALKKAGLAVGKIFEGESREAAPGTVLEQYPSAGLLLTKGRAVALKVAIAPPPPALATVPKLTGLPVEQAREALAAEGLAAGAIREKAYDQARPGTVLAHKPRTGEQVNRGTAVEMVIAVPAATPEAAPAIVPKLGGLTVAEARSALAEAGLKSGIIHRKVYERARPGTVIDQKPGPGQQVKKGTAVEIVMAEAAPEENAPRALPAEDRLTVIAQGETTSKRFWGGKTKQIYTKHMAILYNRIVKDLALRPMKISVETYTEHDLRTVEKMLRDSKRLCESTGSNIVFAATAQESFASSDVESAYWPEVHLVAIDCSSGRRAEQRVPLSPRKDDGFPFEEAMGEAMQKFAGANRGLLK